MGDACIHFTAYCRSRLQMVRDGLDTPKVVAKAQAASAGPATAAVKFEVACHSETAYTA